MADFMLLGAFCIILGAFLAVFTHFCKKNDDFDRLNQQLKGFLDEKPK